MSKDTNESNLNEYLLTLEDEKYASKTRLKCLEALRTEIDKSANVSASDVRRVLAVFIRALKDVDSIPHALNTTLSLLKSGKSENIPVQDYVPSALALLHVIKTLCTTKMLRVLSFEVFLAYPVGVLASMVTYNCSEVVEIFDVYKNDIASNKAPEICNFLEKFLIILPPEQKIQFAKEGIEIWFLHYLPAILILAKENVGNIIVYLESLEKLIDQIIHVDYFKSPHWKVVLESICNTKKFPLIIRNLLRRRSVIWHRFWIILIKLLNNQGTQPLESFGSPINSMLPTLEDAFKLDIPNRCRAFTCWREVIDIFSKKINENAIERRIKLLVVPFKLNNARNEEIATIKFNAWWHLIIKFQPVMEKFSEDALITFIYFAFGKLDDTREIRGVGHTYNSLSLKCIQAFAEICGHEGCDCVIELPRTNGRIMNGKLLAKHWAAWMFSFRSAVQLSAVVYDSEKSKNPNHNDMPILCLWKGLLGVVARLPENKARNDFFNGISYIMNTITMECPNYNSLSHILFNMFILMFDKPYQVLLRTHHGNIIPPVRVIQSILSKGMTGYFKRFSVEEVIYMLKPVTDFLVATLGFLPDIDTFTAHLEPNDSSLKFWIAIIEALFDTNREKLCIDVLNRLLLWPLSIIKIFTDVKYAAKTWYRTYCHLKTALSGISYVIYNVVMQWEDDLEEEYSTTYFKLYIIAGIVKHQTFDEETKSNLMEKFTHLLSRVSSYKEYEDMLPIIVDDIVMMLMDAQHKDEAFGKCALKNVKNILKIIMAHVHLGVNAGSPIDETISIMIKNLILPIGELLSKASCSNVISEIVDLLKDNALTLNIKSSVYKIIEKKVKYLCSCPAHDIVKSKLKPALDTLKENSRSKANERDRQNAGNTPIEKNMKSEEPSIVNRVVENGEEYVVVNTNWKFNPRKLTDNQKDKLQRRRQDIPALYQDLSQSQDEIRLSTWRPDSQDTSTTSDSRTNSNQNTRAPITDLPSSDVVPNIIKNILSVKIVPIEYSGEQSNLNSDKRMSPSKQKEITPETPKDPQVVNVVPVKYSGDNPKFNAQDKRMTPSKQTAIIPEAPNSPQAVNVIPNKYSGDNTKFNSPDKHMPHSKQTEKTPKTMKDPQVANSIGNKDREAESVITDRLTQSEKIALSTPKGTKSPRMALKDRINHNVRNLIEKSKNNATKACNDRLSENITETPINIIKNIVNTDSLSQVERPERVRRRPKKFDDAELIALKKRRLNRANSEIESQTNVDMGSQATCEDDYSSIMVEVSENINSGKNNDGLEQSTEYVTNTQIATSNDVRRNEHRTDKEISLNMQDKENKTAIGITNRDSNSIKSRITSSSNRSSDAVESLNNVETVLNEYQIHENKDTSNQKPNEVIENPRTEESNSNVSLKTPVSKSKERGCKSTGRKKSRIEKELAIDTVEGHPFLKNQRGKRMRNLSELQLRRKSVPEKINKSKPKSKLSPKLNNKSKESDKIDKLDSDINSFTVAESQLKNNSQNVNDMPCSGDIIESSQDSTFTTIGASAKKINKNPVVVVERISPESKLVTQQLKDDDNQQIRDDTELPRNKTVPDGDNKSELTENMDTEPLEDPDIILVNDESQVTLCSESIAGRETQELAEADTLPNDTAYLAEFETGDTTEIQTKILNSSVLVSLGKQNDTIEFNLSQSQVQKDKIEVISQPIDSHANDTIDLTISDDVSSPFKDQRKKDFLNNTSEISPIKIVSPNRETQPSSPGNTSDYVVKLTSPVQSNGEPFENCGSPEFFTEDKTSPDKRDQSPPRNEANTSIGSPSSSLSLKRNRLQVLRSGGRAAHMLGLCVNHSAKSKESLQSEESKKTQTSTPVRRNLHPLYYAVRENDNIVVENADNEKILELRRTLPTENSSPSVPILKRKLTEITDETFTSPASKKKRVSFHDPPVSTTVSILNYIEELHDPEAPHSPRRPRYRTYVRSPKRNENSFVKLDTVLSNAVESFAESETLMFTDDINSLDVTPAVEVVKTSELNDKDPICPDLINCTDSIENIAAVLSSPMTKDLFMEEIKEKVATVGDLAKMTELEVNRLCIKAPKVEIAKKALRDYVDKQTLFDKVSTDAVIEQILEDRDVVVADSIGTETGEFILIDKPSKPLTACVDTQTDVPMTDKEIQTTLEINAVSTQTKTHSLKHTSVQTNESGSKTTFDILKSTMKEESDCIEKLKEHLDEASILKISDKLTTDSIMDLVMKRPDASTTSLLNRAFPRNDKSVNNLDLLKDFLSERFDSRHLIPFCSQLLLNIHDKTTRS